MEYITSRSRIDLPTDQNKMLNIVRYNMWRKKQFPYNDLREGDTLYWYNTQTKQLVWKTKVISVDTCKYYDKKEIYERLEKLPSSGSLDRAPESGYFLGYKIEVIEKIEIDKPDGFRFPQLGWLRVDNVITVEWLNR